MAVNKQAAQKIDVGRFNIGKLSDMEVREWDHIKISNRLGALENLKSDSEYIYRSWEKNKKLSKTSAKRV